MTDIAVIAPLNPSQTDSGSKIRIFNLIKELHATGLRIHLVILNTDELALSRELKALTASISLSGQRDQRLGLLRKLRSPVPAYPEYVQQIKQVLKTHPVDTILACKTFSLAQLDFRWLKKRGIKIIADEACVHHLAYCRRAASSTHALAQIGHRIRARRLKRMETRLLAHTEWASAVSQPEQELLQQMRPEADTLLIPNGINPDDFPPGPSFSERVPELFFCGDYRYGPNADAVAYYQAEIMPLLKQMLPACPLNLAGKNPPPTVANEPWIRSLGYVENIHDGFRRHQIMINPMRQGAGTRLKMLESLTAGMACVSTSVGAEGLGLTDGEQLRIADTPQAFAEAIRDLIQNPEQAAKMAERARAYILKNFTWRQAIAPLLNQLALPKRGQSGMALS